MKSRPITREVFVRPPRMIGEERGKLWKLKKLPYGLAEAGPQWLLMAERWMMGVYGLDRVTGISQLFTNRINGILCHIIAKVTDNLLIAELI